MDKSKVKHDNKKSDDDILVEGFSIEGKLLTSLDSILAILRNEPSFEIAREKACVSVAYVESRDINKKPHSFILFRIYKDKLDVIYTIPENVMPRKRKVDVLRFMYNLYLLMKGHYQVDVSLIIELMENSVKDLIQSLDKNYAELYTAHDRLLKKYNYLAKKYKSLEDEQEATILQNSELRTENEKLRLELDSYKKISDDMLKSKIMDWLKDHDGSIDVYEFSKLHGIVEARVVKALNDLLSEHYIKLISK